MERLSGAVLAEIRRSVSRGRCALLLDFDGVLAPIVRNPRAAHMSKLTAAALRACSRGIPTGIISGRDLRDVRARVGLRTIAYAGSHGMECHIDGHRSVLTPRRAASAAFKSAQRDLLALASEFPSVVVEEKRCCLAINYRALRIAERRRFRRAAHGIVARTNTSALRVLDNKGTFELLAGSTKGESSQRLLRAIAPRGALPIYIGDSLTDEDAFRALKNGITIRVGAPKTTAARYTLRNQASVVRFLRTLAENI